MVFAPSAQSPVPSALISLRRRTNVQRCSESIGTSNCQAEFGWSDRFLAAAA
jgi:hypothetical protein